MSVVTVYAVFANVAEAGTIGRAMVDQRLAACVNILAPCQSVYRWQAEVQDASEVPALFKTTYERSAALIEAIVEAHSYEVPAVAVWPIATLPEPYASWVEENVG